jgi:hypothetical protein
MIFYVSLVDREPSERRRLIYDGGWRAADMIEYRWMMLYGSIFNFAGQDNVEFLLWNQAISVDVSSSDELFELFVSDIFAELCINSAEVFDGNESSSFIVI